MDLVSGALYPGEGGDDADPVVELCDEVTASHLDRWLEVHDLVGDVELVLNGLQSSIQRIDMKVFLRKTSAFPNP